MKTNSSAFWLCISATLTIAACTNIAPNADSAMDDSADRFANIETVGSSYQEPGAMGFTVQFADDEIVYTVTWSATSPESADAEVVPITLELDVERDVAVLEEVIHYNLVMVGEEEAMPMPVDASAETDSLVRVRAALQGSEVAAFLEAGMPGVQWDDMLPLDESTFEGDVFPHAWCPGYSSTMWACGSALMSCISALGGQWWKIAACGIGNAKCYYYAYHYLRYC